MKNRWFLLSLIGGFILLMLVVIPHRIAYAQCGPNLQDPCPEDDKKKTPIVYPSFTPTPTSTPQPASAAPIPDGNPQIPDSPDGMSGPILGVVVLGGLLAVVVLGGMVTGLWRRGLGRPIGGPVLGVVVLGGLFGVVVLGGILIGLLKGGLDPSSSGPALGVVVLGGILTGILIGLLLPSIQGSIIQGGRAVGKGTPGGGDAVFLKQRGTSGLGPTDDVFFKYDRPADTSALGVREAALNAREAALSVREAALSAREAASGAGDAFHKH